MRGTALLNETRVGDMTGYGVLITICGIDGSGKTTQTARLADALLRRGDDVEVLETVPRTDDFISSLRAVGVAAGPQTVSDLIAFERFRRVRRLVEPELAAGRTVICDRWFLTDVAYAVANGCSADFASALWRAAPAPDAQIVLSVPVEEATDRLTQRAATPGWRPAHQPSFLAAADEAFRRHAQLPETHVVDGRGSVTEVQERLWRLVAGLGSDHRATP